MINNVIPFISIECEFIKVQGLTKTSAYFEANTKTQIQHNKTVHKNEKLTYRTITMWQERKSNINDVVGQKPKFWNKSR